MDNDIKCPNGEHVWSNQFGDDWTPTEGTPCDCGLKRWGESRNPFLTRQSEAGAISHGRKSEKRVAKSMGARLHPNSGAMRGAKSDASMKKENFRLEMKSTVKETLPLELAWLTKISQEAVSHGQFPGVVVSFVDPQGVPRMKHHAEWICIPLEVFKELVEE